MITTPLGFEKPQGTDGTSVLRTAIGANADLIDALLTIEAWQSIGTAGNGWSDATGGTDPAAYYKYLGVVRLRGALKLDTTPVSGGYTLTMFTLPAGYRPATPLRFTVRLDNADGSEGTGTINVDVLTDGSVKLRSITNYNASAPNAGGAVYLDGIEFRIA